MLEDAVDHLIQNVLPAAADYAAAESALSSAYRVNPDPGAWKEAALTVKRRAAELAIAIDGLTDRSAAVLGVDKPSIRQDVSSLCNWPGSAVPRNGALERMRGVANAYKHRNLGDRTLPIASEDDVLVVSLGYGLDAFGVGKYDGVEVLVRERSGTKYKVLGDAPVAVAAWFAFFCRHRAVLPAGPFHVCGLQIWP